MLASSFRRLAARIGAWLHALTLRAVPIFIAHQGALLPTVVMTSITIGVVILKESAGIEGACGRRKCIKARPSGV